MATAQQFAPFLPMTVIVLLLLKTISTTLYNSNNLILREISYNLKSAFCGLLAGTITIVVLCVIFGITEYHALSNTTYIASDGSEYQGSNIVEKADGYYYRANNGDLIKIDVIRIIGG